MESGQQGIDEQTQQYISGLEALKQGINADTVGLGMHGLPDGISWDSRPPTSSVGPHVHPLAVEARWGAEKQYLAAFFGPEAHEARVGWLRDHFKDDGPTSVAPDWSMPFGHESVPFVLSAGSEGGSNLRAEFLTRADVLMKRDDPIDYHFAIRSWYAELLAEMRPKVWESVAPLVGSPNLAFDHLETVSKSFFEAVLEYGSVKLEWDLFTAREYASMVEVNTEAVSAMQRSGWEGWGRRAFRLGLQANYLYLEWMCMTSGFPPDQPGVLQQLIELANAQQTARRASAAAQADKLTGRIFDFVEHDEQLFLAFRLRCNVGYQDPLFLGSRDMDAPSLRSALQGVGVDPNAPALSEIVSFRLLRAIEATQARLRESGIDVYSDPLSTVAARLAAMLAAKKGSFSDEEARDLANEYGIPLDWAPRAG